MTMHLTSAWVRLAQCVACVAAACAIIAAPPANAGERTLREMMRPASEAQRDAQRARLMTLRAQAEAEAKCTNCPLYWAILSANLSSLRDAVSQSGERTTALPASKLVTPDARTLSAATAKEFADAMKVHVEALENGERIFGGSRTRPGEFDEVVSIAVPEDGGYRSFCSGTLVAPDTILTAAHCVCDSRFDPSRTVVVFGTDVNDIKHVKAAYSITESAIKHPGKADDTDFAAACQNGPAKGWLGRDLALVRLGDRLPMLGDAAWVPPQPARIAEPQLFFSLLSREVVLVGFGWTEPPEPKIGVQYVTTAPVIDPLCSSSQAGQYLCEAGKEMVVIGRLPAPGKTQADTCGGDSGGPVFVSTIDGSRYLVGATSRASDAKAKNCGPGGVYSLVTPSVVEWLTNANKHGRCITTCHDPEFCARIGPKSACSRK